MDNIEIPATISPSDLDSLSFFAFHPNSSDSDHALINSAFAELSEALAAAEAAQASQPFSTYPPFSTHSPFPFPLSPFPFSTTSHNLSASSTAASTPLQPSTPITGPKLGSRFTREIVRTLKTWLASHALHPYPSEEEMLLLMQRTGLSKAQLTNWFANARRRGKIEGQRTASPQVGAREGVSSPVEIVRRPGTPAFGKEVGAKAPMERWVDSPPEHEPCDVGDIARAVALGSRKTSRERITNGFENALDNTWRSQYARSSASSAATSHSDGFSGQHSSGSQSSLKMRRQPRRKRVLRRRRIEREPITNSGSPYQCTFCTETFKTKYDWQRHEKSLHLPLEQWVCALHGPRGPKTDVLEFCCAFCGEASPSDDHIEAHHYSACQERSLEERTFHRKDHLVQHLRLVHGAKFAAWSMTQWMLPLPDIQSRCGFCGINMRTWVERTDHLAEHFKIGATMADWRGDWGFSNVVLKLVESALPPYFIDYERTTLIPMKASDPSWGSPPNAYELLKVEIEFFVQNYFDKHGQLPTNDAMQLEACRIIFAAEATADILSSESQSAENHSWLRDLIMSSPEITKRARFGPIRMSSESRHSPLTINGKEHLFEQCPLEAHLHSFVLNQQNLKAFLGDGQILNEACAIVRQMEKESSTPSDIFANWIVKGIYSTNWIENFRGRSRMSDVTDVICRNMDACTKPDWGVYWPQMLLPAFSAANPALNSSTSFLHPFIEPHVLTKNPPADEAPLPPSTTCTFDTQRQPHTFLPEDMNFFRCFEGDMKRWVSATMSPKNPNVHVPSDEEIQHQARWIMYGGDDSWNQTPADYAEWLWRFKRDVGIEKTCF